MTSGLSVLAAAPTVSGTIVLAQQQPGGPGGGQGEDFGKSSPVGLLILILFMIAVAFLIRSMTKHLKRLPATFDKTDGEEPSDDAAGAQGRSGDDNESDADVAHGEQSVEPVGETGNQGDAHSAMPDPAGRQDSG